MTNANGTVAVVGRTMDWPVDTVSDLVASPAGQARDGAVGPGSATWTAKHGSVCTSFLGLGCVDGLNTAGLACSMNYLPEAVIDELSVARSKAANNNTPPLVSITQWCQNALDLFADVEEAAASLSAIPPPYKLTTMTLSSGDKAVGHLALTDVHGNNLVVEPVAGGLALHRSTNASSGSQATSASVMTNGPLWPVMADLDSYSTIDGTTAGVPAGDASPDRFVRAAYWRRRTPVPSSPDAAAKVVRSIMKTVSRPIGVAGRAGAPESTSTKWFSVADCTTLTYWLEPADSLAVTVVELKPLNLTDPATPVRLLETGTRQAELGGVVPLDAWKIVPAGGLPGMAGYGGKAHGDTV